MNVLVSVASRHGATRDIGTAVAERLAEHGFNVTQQPPAEVDSVAGYDAVVLGSAIYAGRWLEDARGLVERDRDALGSRPVWLLSSGPIGEPPRPEGDPADAAAMVELTGAREHRVFAGMIERAGLGFGERAIVSLLRAPEGDFRPWPAVREWADGIAADLRENASPR